jgi:hypothetical protein
MGMNFPEEEINELKSMFPGVCHAQEGPYDYFLIPGLKLPPNCAPDTVDVLLCPNQREGYNSRLYFAEVVQSGKSMNWNAQGVWIMNRAWYAFSWQLQPAERRLSQMVAAHLRGLTC